MRNIKAQWASSLVCLALVASFTSCGKKANEQSSANLTQTYRQESSYQLNATQLLVKAVQSNDALLAREAIRRKANLNQRMDNGETFLTYAIINNEMPIFELLTATDLNIDQTNKLGQTALHLAVKKKNLSMVQSLLYREADPNLFNEDDETPLMMAIDTHQLTVAQTIIDAKANLQLENRLKMSALDYANKEGLKNLSSQIQLRIDLEHNIPPEDILNRILLLGDTTALKQLLLTHADLLKSQLTLNPLVVAMQNDDSTNAQDMLIFLIQQGANTNMVDGMGMTALLTAIQLQNQNFTQVLLENHANPNAVDASGESALVYAVKNNSLSLVKMLKNFGAEKKYSTKIKISDKVNEKTFDSCNYAEKAEKNLKAPQDKADNDLIKEELRCGWRYYIPGF